MHLVHLCEVCARLKLSVDDFLGQPRELELIKQAGAYSSTLDYLDEIWSREWCPMCRIVTAATRGSSENLRLHGRNLQNDRILCRLEWNKDGRGIEKPAHDSLDETPATRRLRIFDSEGNFPDAYLVFVVDKNQNTVRSWSLGRTMDTDQVNIRQVHKWLDECLNCHGERCNASYGRSFDALVGMPGFKVIDVQTMTIIESPKAPFVALSYVWGDSNRFRSSKENLRLLTCPGGVQTVIDSLPRTICDVIELTKLLGQRFLWIDSLCIVQDDQEDKERNISTMDLVYGKALFTICIASGDAASGVPGIVPKSRLVNQCIETLSPGIQLMVSRPAEHYIDQSPWNSRAWTFQERMCSRKCLIFVDGRVYFQCQQSTMCEDIYLEDTGSQRGALRWSLELKDAPMRIFMENPLRQYTTCVKLYTERKLTYAFDVLNAFRGIEKILHVNLHSGFLEGLPRSYFDFALLWEPKEQISRRDGCFPSWSWCGWTGGVEYRHSTLVGVLGNLHEWLSTRTWIIWYTSGSDLRLVPVWDSEQEGLVGRWRGYSRCPDSDLYGRALSKKRTVPHQVLPQKPVLPGHSPLLQFWTYSAFFTLAPSFKSDLAFGPSERACLQRYSIADRSGDWCGTILLPEHWAQDEVGKVFEFIAISEARDFSMEEHDSWTYYVPRDRIDSEWDLYFVMLVVTDSSGISERIGLGKVYKEAFRNSSEPGSAWREFALR